MRHLGWRGLGGLGLLFDIACGGGEGDLAIARGHAPAQAEAQTPVAACTTQLAGLDEVLAPLDGTARDVAATESSLVAVVHGGAVVSRDGGASFSPLALQPLQLESDATGYVALVQGGVILLGDAEAEEWVEATAGLPPNAPVEHVARGGGVPLAIAGGVAYRFTDEGWTPLPAASAEPAERVATDGEAFLASSNAGLFASADGAIWAEVPIEPKWAYRSISLAGERRLASSLAVFARSDDGGLTWSTDEEAHLTLGPVEAILDEGPLTLAAGQKGVFASPDGGLSWSLVSGTAGYGSVGLARHGESYFAAAGGLRRHDGNGWGAVDSLRSRHVEGLHAVSGSLFASTYDRRSHRLVAGDWEAMEIEPIVAATEHRGSIFAVTRGIHYTDLRRSDDGGATFTTLTPVGGTATARMGSVLSIGETLLVGSTSVLGGGGATGTVYPGIGIHRSDDGGESWHQAEGLPIEGYHDADTTMHPTVRALFALGEVAYAVVEGAGLFASHDRGASWSLFASGAPIGDQVAVLDTGVAVLVVDGALLALTGDWGPIEPLAAEGLPDGFDIASLLSDGQRLFVSLVGHDAIFTSDDGGQSFQHHPLGDARAMALAGDRLWIAVEGLGLVTGTVACE